MSPLPLQKNKMGTIFKYLNVTPKKLGAPFTCFAELTELD
jgi:hypothetical protein